MSIFSQKNKVFEIDNPVQMDACSDLSSKETQDEEALCSKNRVVAWLFFSFMLAILLARAFYLQVVQGAYYKDIAENNRIRETVLKAPRGIIRDQYGEILARNIPSFDVIFVPAYLPKEEESRKNLADALSKITGQEAGEIKQIIDRPQEFDRNTFLIKENVEEMIAYELVEKIQSFPGVYVGKTARREYQDGKKFSHIIGYAGKITEKEMQENPTYLMIDSIGKDGLEYSYEEYLRGTHGAHRYEVDSSNNIKEDLGIVNPVKGDDLVLNIDAKLQNKISDVLEKIVNENTDATGAVAVAIDPRTGGVRALVSIPGYDNNMFARGITSGEYGELLSDERRPLLSRAISGEYPPGSTFKPFVAAVALEEGIISENTSVDCHGIISIGSWKFPDWKTHGTTDVKKAIAESCDVFFYAVAGGWDDISGLGITKIEQYGKVFGFGDVVGIDLPGELGGNLPSENWKFKTFGEKWYIGDSYHAGIGQGFVTATPLQLANMTAMIANGGTFYRPRIVHEIIDSQTGKSRVFDSEVVVSQVVSEESIRIVREGMRQTVNGSGGSARSLGTLKVATAGKTGTAQFGTEEKTHSWYIAFGPYENPELAMVVLVEGAGQGHDFAVPATREIFQWYFDLERGQKTENPDQSGSEKVSEEESENPQVD